MPVDLTPLLQTGATGAFLVWLMYQVLPRLDRIERAIDAMTRASLLEVLSRESINPLVKRQAESMLHQLENKPPSKSGLLP